MVLPVRASDELGGAQVMELTSPAFEDGAALNARAARHDENRHPPLRFHDIPEAAATLVLLMEDVDSPLGYFTHWLLFNISPEITAIEEGRVPSDCDVGLNGFGTPGYAGPCPPSGRHRYRFCLAALADRIEATEGARKDQVLRDMRGQIIAEAELTGTFDAGY